MTGVPRWLTLQAEIDCALWELEQIIGEVAARSALTVMIDKAAGYEDHIIADVKDRVACIKAMQTEFYALTEGTTE